MTNVQDRNKEKHKDMQNKMDLAKRIVKTCQMTEGKGLIDFIKILTGETTVNFLINDTSDDRKCMRFNDYEFEKAYRKMILDDDIYDHLESCEKVRNIIYRIYIEMRTIPTVQFIEEATKSDIRESNSPHEPTINWILNGKGFELKQLPRTNKAIIVEVAEQANKRKEYLEKIKTYREMNKPMFHLKFMKLPTRFGKRLFTIEDKCIKKRFLIIAVLPVGGWIKHILLSQSSIIEEDFHRWLQLYVIPCLPESSVIVVEANQALTENIDRVPTAFSRKQDMVEWLEQHDIPHNPDQHRAELFLLIEKTTPRINKNVDKFDNIFEFYGHVVLRRPEVASLDYFKGLFEYAWERVVPERVRKGEQVVMVSELITVLKNLTEKQLKDCYDKLSANEQKFYDEDMMVEEIVDKLMTLAKYEVISSEDLEGLDTYTPEGKFLICDDMLI